LRNDTKPVGRACERQIHFAIAVIEDAKVKDLFREPDSVFFGIRPSNTEQNKQSAADLAGNFFADGDPGALYALNHRPHSSI
jgi:hypothetical protein